jgi:hypothetical protein
VKPATFGQAQQIFNDFNQAAVKALGPTAVQEEQDILTTVIYWVGFSLIWALHVAPDAWDTAVFILYVLYDFSSAWELFKQDELSPWAYYAIASFAFGIGHGGYVVALLVMTIVDMFFGEYRFEANNATI